jgi:hypothetical protein
LAPYTWWFWVIFSVALLVSLSSSLLFANPGPWQTLVKSLSLLIWIQALFVLIFQHIYREHRSLRSTGEEQFFHWVMEWGGGIVCLSAVVLLTLSEALLLLRWLFG